MGEKEKCFVMMPISDQGDYPEGHFTKVYEQIFKPAIENAGYEAYRVDENVISDPIIGKIFEAIQNCPMALCDLSNRNPNVLYELGIRQAYDKPVVLVQDDKTERIFDVSGISTIQYKSVRLYENVIDARERIANAIIDTKEGKKNSIIKIVKAQMAEISKDEISKEDKIEILLSGLAEDIRELKFDKDLDKRSRLEAFQNNNWDRISYPFSANDKAMTLDQNDFAIVLKSGITNKEIEKAIQGISRKYMISIQHKRDGATLEVEFDKKLPYEIKLKVVEEIINTISVL